MQMTEAYCSAVTVSIPIFALAAGAEARAVRERLRETDEAWEKQFAAYRAAHDLDPSDAPGALRYLTDLPMPSKVIMARRMVTIAAAIGWLIVFVVLAIAELYNLLWLADGEPRGHSTLAVFSLVAIGISLLALIVAPAAYLLVPVLMPLDFMPHSMRKVLGDKLSGEHGTGFVKLVFSELEGAINRAADKVSENKDQQADDLKPAIADAVGIGVGRGLA